MQRVPFTDEMNLLAFNEWTNQGQRDPWRRKEGGGIMPERAYNKD